MAKELNDIGDIAKEILDQNPDESINAAPQSQGERDA